MLATLTDFYELTRTRTGPADLSPAQAGAGHRTSAGASE